MGHRVTTLNVNTIEPAGNTLTIGASGDTVVLADDVKANTYKDAGGNTLFVSNGSGVLSSVNSGFGDSLKLLSTQTASGNSSIDFSSGLDSTYKEYIFKVINCHPASTDQSLFFNGSTDSGSSNAVKTTTMFNAYNRNDGGAALLTYDTGDDEAQSTDPQLIIREVGFDDAVGNEKSGVAELHLFNPASTTYVKNWYCVGQSYGGDNTVSGYTWNVYTAGYFNTTSAIDWVTFHFGSGNVDYGIFKMYGVK